MGLRVTTWNVNGIRNPFGYQPWRDKRTFEAMFDILEADIVVFQETKIQRKDLRDDMVLVPGWDCYWSLPRHKKGYSGVVVYTRNSKCAPIRAEEGITGILTPPNCPTSFRDLPDSIGGYPTSEQLTQSEFDAAAIDAEGRCVILEFPAFVLIGTYCPAERDETRTHFRTAFLDILDARIRNLVTSGKRVIWTGDFNISREEIDTAMADEMKKRNGVDHEGWISTPARRMFNQMLVEGKVHGERDPGREQAIMWDVCRAFQPDRTGMYTCWETKVNARPGNFGARIDYVVCSHDMRDWWSDSNIQEGLHGSDHCPVYGVLKDVVTVEGQQRHILDLMNPPGMFEQGVRKQEWSTKDLLATSGKLIPEFDRRRNIKDMFSLKPKAKQMGSHSPPKQYPSRQIPTPSRSVSARPSAATVEFKSAVKRPLPSSPNAPASKRIQSESKGPKGQKSLTGFFKSVNEPKRSSVDNPTGNGIIGHQSPRASVSPSKQSTRMTSFDASLDTETDNNSTSNSNLEMETDLNSNDDEGSSSFLVHEITASVTPAATAQSWGKLFARPVAPKCEHDEPCKTMLTKKPGVNCGRSFWMCNRPLGPSGKQERSTQWRCNTFIWASAWESRHESGSNIT